MADKQKKLRSQYRRTLLSLFLVVLLIVPALYLILDQRDFSKLENRALKQKPPVTVSTVKDGSFQKALMGFMEDQFPGRDQFIRLNAHMERLLFRMENNDVYIHSRENLIDKFQSNSDELTREKAGVINGFAKEHPGMKLSVMLIPTKSEILSDQLPPFAPEPSQKEYLDKLHGLMSSRVNVVDLLPSLNEKKQEYLFFRSDHHWTQEGAFLAQGVYLTSLGLKPREAGEYEVTLVARDFLGSLTSKSGIAPSTSDEVSLYLPKEPEDVIINLTEEQLKLTSFYQPDKLEGQDKYLVFLGGNYPVVRISTASTADRRLLIIKDSFANAFVPFMTQDFNEITMVDMRYYTGDINELVEDYLITDALVLYNTITFNDDNSILNIGDTLSENRDSGEEASGETGGEGIYSTESPLEVVVRANPHEYGQFYIGLRNTSGQGINYKRGVQLERQVEGTWVKISELPGFSWDDEERTVGAYAKAEYLIDLEEVFGPLEEGRFRIIQTFNGDQTVTGLFSFAGSHQ